MYHLREVLAFFVFQFRGKTDNSLQEQPLGSFIIVVVFGNHFGNC